MSHREKRRALGARLRFEREAICLTRDELAERLDGVPAMLIKRWELGRTRIPAEILTDLAAALGITVERLLAGAPRIQVSRAQGMAA